MKISNNLGARPHAAMHPNLEFQVSEFGHVLMASEVAQPTDPPIWVLSSNDQRQNSWQSLLGHMLGSDTSLGDRLEAAPNDLDVLCNCSQPSSGIKTRLVVGCFLANANERSGGLIPDTTPNSVQ